ncbi:MAG: hypothetical protein ACLR3C_08060 [Eggerthella lenta]
MGLTRNRAFACQLALLAGALAVFAAAAAAVEGPRAPVGAGHGRWHAR